jgi:cytosine/adenosine deaminase-related metal-dependent hydrolase
MILHNVRLADSVKVVDIEIVNDKIIDVNYPVINSGGEFQLYFDDCIVFPGLINSHDHLDFNLFPQLGNRI